MKDEPPHTKFQTSPLRKGLVNSARGAGKFRSDAIAATRRAGIKTVICARLNSAFYNHSVIAAILAAPGPRPRHRRTSHRRAERLCHGAFPSASFSANGAWLACAVIAYLTRTALLNIPARLSYSASTYTLHLPINSRRETPFMNTFTVVMAPTQAA